MEPKVLTRHSYLSRHDLCAVLELTSAFTNAWAEADLRTLLSETCTLVAAGGAALFLLGKKSGEYRTEYALSYPAELPAVDVSPALVILINNVGIEVARCQDGVQFASAKHAKSTMLGEAYAECLRIVRSSHCILTTHTTDHMALSSICIFGCGTGTRRLRALTVISHLSPHLHFALIRASSMSKTVGALSKREREILHWIKNGKTSGETAKALNIAERTVVFHVQNAMRKLGAANRAQAVALAFNNRSELQQVG